MNNNIDNKYDNESEQSAIAIGNIVYYARIMPKLDVYDVYELRVRTVEDTYFSTIDKKDKNSYLFSYNDIGKTVFFNWQEDVDKTKEAEKNKPKVSAETYYEEY